MKKYVGSMVVYPPEEKYPEERKFIVYYTIEEDQMPDECFELKYWHHVWASNAPIKIGAMCLCGRERAIEDK